MRISAAFVAALLFVLGGCSGTTQSGPSAYDLTEFAVSGPSKVDPGASTMTVSNSGDFPHTLVIADETGRVVAATDLIEPGEVVDLSVSLDPGEFQFTCRIVAEKPDGQIVDHFEAGMSRTVRVEG